MKSIVLYMCEGKVLMDMNVKRTGINYWLQTPDASSTESSRINHRIPAKLKYQSTSDKILPSSP